MMQTEFKAFSELLRTVADYYGKTLTPASVKLYWNAMTAHDLQTVRGALNDHIQVSRYMPSIAELLDQLRQMDGRPNAEEAWANCARALNDENVTLVWTDEMSLAFGVALGLRDDRVAARMAFKECYERAVSEARKNGVPTQWSVSLGHDPQGREGPLMLAVKQGRLPMQQVTALLPKRESSQQVATT